MKITMGGIGMEISWIESVIYGFIAGLTEILPVSSHAHQNIMQSLFGLTDGLAFLRFSASVGAFVAFLFSMWLIYVVSGFLLE